MKNIASSVLLRHCPTVAPGHRIGTREGLLGADLQVGSTERACSTRTCSTRSSMERAFSAWTCSTQSSTERACSAWTCSVPRGHAQCRPPTSASTPTPMNVGSSMDRAASEIRVGEKRIGGLERREKIFQGRRDWVLGREEYEWT
jgi:hypothetical protein